MLVYVAISMYRHMTISCCLVWVEYTWHSNDDNICFLIHTLFVCNGKPMLSSPQNWGVSTKIALSRWATGPSSEQYPWKQSSNPVLKSYHWSWYTALAVDWGPSTETTMHCTQWGGCWPWMCWDLAEALGLILHLMLTELKKSLLTQLRVGGSAWD